MEQKIKPDNNGKKNGAVFIIAGAVAFVAALSFIPWNKLTDGKLKDFNIIQDIISSKNNDTATETAESTGEIDPALLEIMQQNSDEVPADTTVETVSISDSIIPAPAASKIGDSVVIEDYTVGKQGLKNLKRAIVEDGCARIAVIGDSYIEGDIMTQNLRENFQKTYGGSGVGYVNMYSEFPGFRRSVRQGGNGWKEYAASKNGKKQYLGLSEHYYKSTGAATASYKGVKSLSYVDKWQKSQVLFIAPNPTKIKVRTDNDWQTHNIEASDSVQAILINGMTDRFEIKSDDSSTIFLGTWLDGSDGVSVDCMSSRGYSGITLTDVNADLCRQMSRFVDYDLIILEFGINAMSAKQKDYTVYSSRLTKVINHMRRCYPDADILLMGIGDRGEKRNGEIHSMASAPYMVKAQRDAARTSRCLFWDTREAMGGEDAIVQWSKQGLANKDYIHLTHKGGAELARPLFDALKNLLEK